MMFDHLAFFSKEMRITLASLLVNSFVILTAFQVPGSAGDGFIHYYVEFLFDSYTPLSVSLFCLLFVVCLA